MCPFQLCQYSTLNFDANSLCLPISRSPRDLLRFMPKFMKKECSKQSVDAKLRDTFKKFKDIRSTIKVEHYEAKYMEVYEKDLMCGKHIFRLKNVSS